MNKQARGCSEKPGIKKKKAVFMLVFSFYRFVKHGKFPFDFVQKLDSQLLKTLNTLVI